MMEHVGYNYSHEMKIVKTLQDGESMLLQIGNCAGNAKTSKGGYKIGDHQAVLLDRFGMTKLRDALNDALDRVTRRSMN